MANDNRNKDETTWIKKHEAAALTAQTAVVGSSGLRSVGKLVVDNLIEKTKAHLTAELYSTHFPSIYQTKPSYTAHPKLPGIGGAIVETGNVDLPKVQFYASSEPPLIIVRGYHANFEGQYEVAEKTLDYLKEAGITKLIVAAAYGSKEIEPEKGTTKEKSAGKDTKICCAATNKNLIHEMKEKFNIGTDYHGPFCGFSGLTFGLSKLKNIEALCLFAGTQADLEDPEAPDKESANLLLNKLIQILNLKP